MGYTHYWHQNNGHITEDAWQRICDDANKLLDQREPGRPTDVSIDAIQILFEGGFETFRLTRRPLRRGQPSRTGFAWCKTNRALYDKWVCAILACAAEHAPEQIKIESNGSPADWAGPVEWASGVLGRQVRNPIMEEVE